MSLSKFIEDNLESILADWVEFASTLQPAAGGMARADLRNLAEQMLRSVLGEMATAQSELERHQKSLGEAPAHAPRIDESARGHAADRLAESFTLDQLVAEYRALRASVIRKWRTQLSTVGTEELEELTRFNEAIDQSLTVAVGWYNGRVEHARELMNGVLAHDLRNPVAAILMSAQVLLGNDSLSEKERATVTRIEASGTRVQRLIDDLLDFTRTRFGAELPMSPAHADLARIIRTVVDELNAYHPDAGVRWSASGDLTGQWDVSRIEQMLSNLIGNAIEHGHRGSATVSARGDAECIAIQVHNEGAIPSEQQASIFDPLKRAISQADEKDSGLGLGLYIAQIIATAHGGSIELASGAEHGTTFTVRLPHRSSG